MRDRSFKIAIFSLVLVLLVSIGVGFALFQTTLTINGSATVKASSWGVKFANLGTAQLAGTAQEVTAPQLTTEDTYIGDYKVTLKSPGDSVTYTFDVVNTGTFNAKITSLPATTPQCTGTGDDAATDQQNVCNNITYTLTYADGSAINVNDTLDAGATKNLKLTLTYNANIEATQLPKADVEVTNLQSVIVYSHAE